MYQREQRSGLPRPFLRMFSRAARRTSRPKRSDYLRSGDFALVMRDGYNSGL